MDTDYQIAVVNDGDDVVEPFDYTEEMKNNPSVLSQKINEIISKHIDDNKPDDEDNSVDDLEDDDETDEDDED